MTELQTIYDDVAELMTRVASLEAQVSNLQVSDSGWIDLTLLNGVQAYNENQVPQYRKIGNRVYLRGVFKNVTTFPTNIAQLPVDFRPSQRIIYFMATNGVNIARLEIELDGSINVMASNRTDIVVGTHYSLGTLTFLID